MVHGTNYLYLWILLLIDIQWNNKLVVLDTEGLY